MTKYDAKLKKLEKHVVTSIHDESWLIDIERQRLQRMAVGLEKLGYPVDAQKLSDALAALDENPQSILQLSRREKQELALNSLGYACPWDN